MSSPQPVSGSPSARPGASLLTPDDAISVSQSAPSRETRPPRVVTFGETMALMHSTGVGSLAHVPTVNVGIGGAESNVAIGLRRLGIGTAWLGRIGDDELGRRVVREIRGEGVEVIDVVDPVRPTGLMIKSHPVAGSTAVRYYRTGSAASALTPSDIPTGLIENATVLHLSGITPILTETARHTVLAAVARARSAGVQISFDVNYRATLATRARTAPVLREIAELADIVFGGPDELALLLDSIEGAPGNSDEYPVPTTTTEEEALLHTLAARGITEAVQKRGPGGAWALVAGHLVKAPAYRVEVVDTVGAGDAFVAGYLSAHLEGLDVPARLARANACGAFMCMSPGDWEGAPRPSDLQSVTGAESDPVRR